VTGMPRIPHKFDVGAAIAVRNRPPLRTIVQRRRESASSRRPGRR
jgi:hypothetical protein